MKHINHRAIEDMKYLLNEKFFGEEIDAAFYRLRYGVRLLFVSSKVEFKFFIRGFGEQVCYGAIFVYTHRLFKSVEFMDFAWQMAVEVADGQQLCADAIPKGGVVPVRRECPAVEHKGTIFIYANSCIFFTNPISSFGSTTE